MELVKQAYLKGERALFKSHDLKVEDSIFADGESPLKESDHIDISGSIFKWKYPLWYCNHINVENSTLLETARSGIWYTHHINIKDSVIDAPKTFRRGTHISLENVNMVNAQETLWKCSDIKLYNNKVQVHQKNTEVYIQTIKNNFTIKFDNAIEAVKFVTKVTDAVTGTTMSDRGVKKVKNAFDKVDDVLGFDTRGTVKGVIENGITGTLLKGIKRKDK